MHSSSPLSRLRPHWPLFMLLLIALPLLLIRLEQVPYPWYDEGLNINAARSLATTGLYGLPTDQEVRLVDPAIQSGPPIIALMAFLYKMFGASLLPMRLMMVVFGLLTLIVLYQLAYRLYGALGAFLTGAFLIMIPGDSTGNFILLSRQVLGEIPAILCLVLGFSLMVDEQPRHWKTILTGLLFGAAIVLKSQVLLILTITLLVWLIIQLRQRSGDWKRWVVIIGVMGLVYTADTLVRAVMAGSAFAQNTQILREGIFIHILPFRLRNILSLSVVLRMAFMAVSVALTLWLRRKNGAGAATAPRDSKQTLENILLLFVTLWLIWYGLISIGWQRYAFIGEVMAALLLSGVLAALWKRFGPALDYRVYALSGLAVVLASVVMYSEDLTRTEGEQFYSTMNYINQNLPPQARIVSWEWPASFFTQATYIYPSTHAVNMVTRNAFFNAPIRETLFEPLAACPEYILLGSLDLDRILFRDALAAAAPEPVFSAGKYQLYIIPPENLNRQPDGSCTAKSS